MTAARMGAWSAGRQRLVDSEVALIVGANPLVSLGAYELICADPVRNLEAARARGVKIIVIDPRRTETAALADCHIQPAPGHDAMLAAALVNIVLSQEWYDTPFCERYVDGVDALRTALAPFTPLRRSAPE